MPKFDIPPYEEQVMNKCRHFNGAMNQKCEAGIEYASFSDTGTAKRLTLPCFADGYLASNGERGHCDQCSFPTLEEALEEKRRVEQQFENMAIVRKEIVEMATQIQRATKRRGCSGRLQCPICQTGTVQ